MHICIHGSVGWRMLPCNKLNVISILLGTRSDASVLLALLQQSAKALISAAMSDE